MERIQIQFTAEQLKQLREVAATRGVSIAQVVRDSVDAQLAVSERQRQRQRALEHIGGFRSGREDVSSRHDDHLADSFV